MILLFLLQAASQDLPSHLMGECGLFPPDAYTAVGVSQYADFLTVPDTSGDMENFRVKGNLAEWAARNDVVDPNFWDAIAEKGMLGKGFACYPLEIAVARGNLSLVSMLLERGADPKILNQLNIFSGYGQKKDRAEICLFNCNSKASLIEVAQENLRQIEMGLDGASMPSQYQQIIELLQPRKS